MNDRPLDRFLKECAITPLRYRGFSRELCCCGPKGDPDLLSTRRRVPIAVVQNLGGWTDRGNAIRKRFEECVMDSEAISDALRPEAGCGEALFLNASERRFGNEWLAL